MIKRAVLLLLLQVISLFLVGHDANADDGDPRILDGLYRVPEERYFYRGREYFHAAIDFEIYQGRISSTQQPLIYLGSNTWEMPRTFCTPGSTRGNTRIAKLKLVNEELHYSHSEGPCDPDSDLGSSERSGIAHRLFNIIVDSWYNSYHPDRDMPPVIWFAKRNGGDYVVRTTFPMFHAEIIEFDVVEVNFTTTSSSLRTFESTARNLDCPERALFRILKHESQSLYTQSFSKDSLGSCENGDFRRSRSLYLQTHRTPQIAPIISPTFPPPEPGSCPLGYVSVPGDDVYGTKDFCVMKYEAKANAESTAVDTPFVHINENHARSACEDKGRGFHLITNPEWMTVAASIAKTAANWSGGRVGAGALNRGHSDQETRFAALDASQDSDPCAGTGQTCNQNIWDDQRRTHTLFNGEIVWDLAGNVWEWVDAYGPLRRNEMHPWTVSHPFWNDLWDMNQGIGDIRHNARGALIRGGSSGSAAEAGIFAADGGPASVDTFDWIGFRCTYSEP